MAMPSTLFSPRPMAPARAETSPSLHTTRGMSGPNASRGGPDIDVLYLLVELVFGHLQEQGGYHSPVVDVDAGGGDAHRIHPGHLLGGGLESGDDAVIVIVGVLGDLGEPDHFLGVDGLAVDDSGHLAVAAAGVEAHPAARQMAADSLGGARLLGDLVAEDHLEGALVHAGHEVGVKGPGAAGGEGLFQIVVNVLVAR